MYTARNDTNAVVVDATGQIIGPENAREWSEYLAWVARGNSAKPAPRIRVDAGAVKLECQRRIYQVASLTAQLNMATFVASGAASEEDRAASRRETQWVADMRSACSRLIADDDATYLDDVHWPPCPDDVVQFISRF